LAQPCEFFVVFATTAPASVQYILDTGTNSQTVYVPDGTFKTFAGVANIGPGLSVSANVVHRGNVQLNGASTNVILDAGSPGTGNPGANSGTTTLTVGNYGGGGVGLIGGLYEIIGFPSLLSAPDRAAVNAYLTSLYT
jgi:hypothetical protein